MSITRNKIEEVIERGGSVKTDTSKIGSRKICQNIRSDVFDEMMKAVKKRAGMTRSAWIQEAIQEKLKRLIDVSQD